MASMLLACAQGLDTRGSDVGIDLTQSAEEGGSQSGGSTTRAGDGQAGTAGASPWGNHLSDAAARGGWNGAVGAGGDAGPRPPAVSVDTGKTADSAPESRSPIAPDNSVDRDGTVASVCSGICNAAAAVYPVVSDGSGRGNITMYATTPSAGGACNYGTTGVELYAAMNVHVVPGDYRGQWRDGKACGQCVEVTAYTSRGPKSVVVRIMDRCADVDCGVDLGGTAPSVVMADNMGRYNGEWSFVSCAGHPEVSDGPPVLFVNSGSNEYWSLVQIRYPDWPVAKISWHAAANPATGGSFSYAGTLSENFWQVPSVLLRTSERYILTIEYDDQSTSAIEVTSADLANPGNTIALR